MDESLSSWLRLREPADIAARSAALTHATADVLARDTPLRVLDLGAGTGSNLRYLVGRLPDRQDWLLVDHDPALLGEVPLHMSSWGAARGYRTTPDLDGLVLRGGQLECHVRTRCMELGALDDPEIFSGRHLVTASALLDLVSETWLRALAVRCRAGGAAVLFALTYNGQSRCLPVEPEDDTIRDLMNRHQKANDKGFGRAEGPDAAECAARSFAEVGYHVRREASDWVLSSGAKAVQRELFEGWAHAAIEVAPTQSSLIHGWLTRRLAHVEAGRSRVIVGHEDLAAWLPSATWSARGR